MTSRQQRISTYAAHTWLQEKAEELGNKYLVINYTDDTLKDELTQLLPQHLAGIRGHVSEIRTCGSPTKAGEYYPKGSIFHIGIIYSGQSDTAAGHHFFRNLTAHYDKDMNLMVVQFHHNQPEDGWLTFSGMVVEAIHQFTK